MGKKKTRRRWSITEMMEAEGDDFGSSGLRISSEGLALSVRGIGAQVMRNPIQTSARCRCLLRSLGIRTKIDNHSPQLRDMNDIALLEQSHFANDLIEVALPGRLQVVEVLQKAERVFACAGPVLSWSFGFLDRVIGEAKEYGRLLLGDAIRSRWIHANASLDVAGHIPSTRLQPSPLQKSQNESPIFVCQPRHI